MVDEQAVQASSVETQTGLVGFQIVATLLGGTLLICALLAKLLFDSPNGEVSGMIGGVATLLLAGPLVWMAMGDLLQGKTHLNVLVALAVVAAFAMGAQVKGWGYLEAGAIAFFMIISVLIENRTALGAQASIESLVKITPTRANKLTEDGEEVEMDVKDLRPGDVVRVRPGDNIPADGKVLTGTSTVNQANITGESLPADKAVDDEVFGGTINLTGMMDIQVTKAGEDTTLGRVKQMIIEAERTRIPLARMVDQYAQWYTPTVLMLVFIVWFFISRGGGEKASEDANMRAIAMLVIAAPIPLILATPTAMVAALSAAARLGVLVKSVVNLEAARNLTSMIFDKTGTLTTGELEVSRLSPAENVEGAELLRVAAAVEQNSRHPVARAVVKVAKQAKLQWPGTQDFQEVAGKGVHGVFEGKPVWVGRANWVAEQVPAVKAGVEAALESKEVTGLSTLFVVHGDALLGWVGLADNTRPEAAASMDALRQMGLKRLIIVTGDRESVAERVAAQLHTEYTAEVLPHQKLEIVDELKSRGHKVGMVGDGVNDAPALAAGDISIAMGAAGSDVAIHSASIVINNNNLNRIPFLIRLSRQTSAVIKQNLTIGGGFIVIFLSLAAAGIVNPIAAAALQVVSSLLVVFNSARLVRCGEDIEHAESAALASRTQRPRPRQTEPASQQIAGGGEVNPA